MADSDHKSGDDGQHNRIKVSSSLVAKLRKQASPPVRKPPAPDPEDHTIEDPVPMDTVDLESGDEGAMLVLSEQGCDSQDATLDFLPDAERRGAHPDDDAPTIDQIEESLPALPTLPDHEAPKAAPRRSAPQNINERLRGLSPAEQQRRARNGELSERKVLERLYGRNVWESLLKNPRFTPPEVSRISRMGALPLPLLELIVSNRSWLSAPQVRRALLSNRRLTREMVNTVLRATPKAELKLMAKQMAYPATVREAAAKMCR